MDWLTNPSFMVSVSAIVVALCNTFKKWLEVKDREQRRAAVLKLHGNAVALEALSQIDPPSTSDVSSGQVILLVLGFSAAIGSSSIVGRGDTYSAKECSSSADCHDGERCERGRCVSNARKPCPPGSSRPSSGKDEPLPGSQDVAMWWAPRSLRRDQFETALSSY